jgi:hypothetical protein
MLREREERKELEGKLYAERKKKEEEEELLEKLREMNENKIKEEQDKRDHEEYLKLKQEFTVEEEGHDTDLSLLDSENLLKTFVDFIIKSKIVILEELAAEFKLKTQVNTINYYQHS